MENYIERGQDQQWQVEHILREVEHMFEFLVQRILYECGLRHQQQVQSILHVGLLHNIDPLFQQQADSLHEVLRQQDGNLHEVLRQQQSILSWVDLC